MVPRKLYGPRRDEVTADCMKLHSEELYDLYFSANFIWVIKTKE
jgi:hypothetical protein